MLPPERDRNELDGLSLLVLNTGGCLETPELHRGSSLLMLQTGVGGREWGYFFEEHGTTRASRISTILKLSRPSRILREGRE